MLVFRKGPATKLISLCIPLIIGCVPVQHTPEHETRVRATFYVAPASFGGSDSHPGTIGEPFLTLERAKQAVRNVTKDMTGDAIVYLRGGTYELEEPIVFQAHDSGQNSGSIWLRKM